MSYRFYLAAPVVTEDQEVKDQVDCVYRVLMDTMVDPVSKFIGENNTLYRPGQHKVPNAWGITMEMWGQCVFTMDVLAIDEADWIVLCNYGRKGATAGTAWECGYAFAKGKKILVVNMPGVEESSLMVTGCASNVVNYGEFISADAAKMRKEIFRERGKIAAEQTLN